HAHRLAGIRCRDTVELLHRGFWAEWRSHTKPGPRSRDREHLYLVGRRQRVRARDTNRRNDGLEQLIQHPIVGVDGRSDRRPQRPPVAAGAGGAHHQLCARTERARRAAPATSTSTSILGGGLTGPASDTLSYRFRGAGILLGLSPFTGTSPETAVNALTATVSSNIITNAASGIRIEGGGISVTGTNNTISTA